MPEWSMEPEAVQARNALRLVTNIAEPEAAPAGWLVWRHVETGAYVTAIPATRLALILVRAELPDGRLAYEKVHRA